MLVPPQLPAPVLPANPRSFLQAAVQVFFMFCCLEGGKEKRLNGEEAKCGLKIVNEKM